MNLILAILAWVFIGAVIGVGIYLFAVHSSPWLMIIAALAFVVAVGKIGCATH